MNNQHVLIEAKTHKQSIINIRKRVINYLFAILLEEINWNIVITEKICENMDRGRQLETILHIFLP